MCRPVTMPVTIGDGLAFCGHALTDAELELIRRITREFANLAWTELAATICELLKWRRPNGGLKIRECYLFLRELHRRGWLPWLTAPQPKTPSRPSGETRPGIRPPRRFCWAVRSLTTAPSNSNSSRTLTSAVSSARISTVITTSATALPTVHNYDTGCGRRSPNCLLWPLCYLPAPPGAWLRATLDWLERCGAPAQSTPGGQSQSIPDSPLGPHPPPRQPYPGTRRAPVAAQTGKRITSSPPCSWKPWSTRRATGASVIAPPTGSPSA